MTPPRLERQYLALPPETARRLMGALGYARAVCTQLEADILAEPSPAYRPALRCALTRWRRRSLGLDPRYNILSRPTFGRLPQPLQDVIDFEAGVLHILAEVGASPRPLPPHSIRRRSSKG